MKYISPALVIACSHPSGNGPRLAPAFAARIELDGVNLSVQQHWRRCSRLQLHLPFRIAPPIGGSDGGGSCVRWRCCLCCCCCSCCRISCCWFRTSNDSALWCYTKERIWCDFSKKGHILDGPWNNENNDGKYILIQTCVKACGCLRFFLGSSHCVVLVLWLQVKKDVQKYITIMSLTTNIVNYDEWVSAL